MQNTVFSLFIIEQFDECISYVRKLLDVVAIFEQSSMKMNVRIFVEFF